MPTKSRPTSRAVPVDYLDPAIGIEPPELTEIVGAALSRVLFAYKDSSGNLLTSLHRFLRLYATTEITRGRSASPMPNPTIEPDDGGWGRATARRRLGVDAEDELEIYAAESRLDGPVAKVPAKFLAEYVPVELWPVVASLVEDGPSTFESRVEQLLFAERERKVKETRRRPEGGYISQTMLEHLWKMARRFAAGLRAQAGDPRNAEVGPLRPWQSFTLTVGCPESRAGVETVTDNSAPPTYLARVAYQKINREIRDALGLGDSDDELEAIETAPWSRMAHLFTRLRNRAIFVCLATLGPRLDELVQTRQSAFVPEYRFTGGVAPALFLRHPKTREPDAFHPMPKEAGLAVQSYIAFLARWTAENRKPELGAEDPLFLGRLSSRTQIGGQAIERWLGGSSVEGRSPAALPITPGQPDVGYRPHSLRKRLKSWCSGLEAEQWCRANGVDPGRREAIGEACLAHDLKGMAALYLGDTTREGKEQLRYWGACIAWGMLAGELGQRRIPDEEAYRSALREAKARRKALEDLEREIEMLCSEAERTGRELSPAAILGRSQRASRWARELTDVDRAIIEIEVGLPHTLSAVDDQIPDDDVPKVDLAAIKEEELNGAQTVADRRIRRVRNWITPDELALIIGRGPSTVREWVRKGLPKTAQIWDRDRPPIREFGKNRRAILADGIYESALDTPEKREALADLLAQDPPTGWSHLPLMTSV